MATTENEHYLRSILMLTEGGSYISKMVLYRELSGDLDTLLKSFKCKLNNELHEKQLEKLFPSHGKTVVDTWDLQMLIIVILRLFHVSLKQEDKRNLRVIKMLRHEVQAHNPGPTLDDVQYENIKDQLTDALTSLASGFDEDVQKECQSCITKYASGPLDVMSARECLKQLQENDAMFKQVLEKVEQSNNDIRSCVNTSTTVVSQRMADLEKILLEKLERLDIGTCRKKIKVGMHVELVLGGPTEEWILLMERTLNDIFNEAYKTSGGKFENMKKRVEELLDDIKQNTTIKFKGSKTKCIILMFECFTFAGLLDFLQYITSQQYQDRLDALTMALSAHFRVDFPVTVTSKIKDECLQNAIDILDTTVEHDEMKQNIEVRQSHPSDGYKKSLRLAMECSSAEDLVYLWKMFQQGGAKQYLDRIADVLSEHSGQRITLTSSIDLEEFTEAIDEAVGSGHVANYVADDLFARRSAGSTYGASIMTERDVAGSTYAGLIAGSVGASTGMPAGAVIGAAVGGLSFAGTMAPSIWSGAGGESTSRMAEVADSRDAMDKMYKVCVYFYGDDGGVEETDEMLVQLLVEAEDIRRVFVYKYPLTPFSLLNFWLYHMVIVFETKTWWWSMEKSSDGITIQRSKTSEELLKLYRNTSRKYGNKLQKSRKGHSSVAELINLLNKTGELQKDYNFLTSNCTTFANVVLDYITKHPANKIQNCEHDNTERFPNRF